MRLKLIIIILGVAVSGISTFAQMSNTPGRHTLHISALKINVDDMDKALAFYGDKLGFEVADRSDYPQKVVLKTDDNFKLILYKVKRLRRTGDKDTGVSFTLQVNELTQSIERMKSLGVPFAESTPRQEGVGNAISILDPFGRKVSLMHQTIVKVEPFKEPHIYNFGILVPDMNAGREFYENKLGFVARSEKYLPLDMPLSYKDNAFAFMLHYRQGTIPIKSEYPEAIPFVTIIFETDNLSQALNEMKQRGIKIVPETKGKPVVFEDPFGNISELIELKK